MTKHDYVTIRTNRKPSNKMNTFIKLVKMMLVLSLVLYLGNAHLTPTNNPNMTGKNYGFTVFQTQTGIYTQENLMSFYSGNTYLGMTAGIEDKKPFIAVHTLDNCYGDCETEN